MKKAYTRLLLRLTLHLHRKTVKRLRWEYPTEWRSVQIQGGNDHDFLLDAKRGLLEHRIKARGQIADDLDADKLTTSEALAKLRDLP